MHVENLAVPCAPGGIDYFVSHSWHDDADAKHLAWDQLFGEFVEVNGRPPMVWLDEIIINQADIEVSLKCLPVYLMACRRVLVLCGDTYCRRLWCIW